MEYLTFHPMASGLSKGRLVLQGTKVAMSIVIGGCGGLQLLYTLPCKLTGLEREE